MIIFAVQLKLTQFIVLAVVNLVADKTFFVTSEVLSTFHNPTCVFVSQVRAEPFPLVASFASTFSFKYHILFIISFHAVAVSPEPVQTVV
jgi:hypothetical protein